LYNLNKKVGVFMQNLNTVNQNPNKIVSVDGYWVGSLTLISDKDLPSMSIQLTSLEEMWYGHEENINHPVDSEYPLSVNVPHFKAMRERVFASVYNRTGVNPADYSSILHATTSPARNKDGSIRDDVVEGRYVLRNV
jgi:predicted double-glycine peptidase